MAGISAGILAAAALGTAATSGTVTAIGAQRQAESQRRAETRARGLAQQERTRQARQESLIAAREQERSQQIGARLRATAGRRAGRRSLFTGAETGVSANDNQSVSQLGRKTLLGQ